MGTLPFQTPQTQTFALSPNRRTFASTKRHSSVAIRISSTAAATTNNNALIQSLCQQGSLKKALQLLSREPNPTQHTYELLILSCAHQNSLPDAQAVHRHLLRDGFAQDPFLATKLIDMYSKLGSLRRARKVFDKTRSRTVFVWNALFRALTLAGHGEETLHLYRRMNRRGIPSDRFTYTYVLKACHALDSINVLHQIGKAIHAHILRHGYEANLHIMTTLLDMYARFGQASYASRVFYGMPEKNVVSWSAMIACYVKNGEPLEALSLFREMVLENNDMLPNAVTVMGALQACAGVAALEQGRLIHGYILRRNLESVLPVVSTLVAMYGRCGKLELGQRIFDRVNRKDVVLWNALISSYGIHGYGEKAVAIFREMIKCGVKPSAVSFISVLGASSHAGLVEEGKALFESMEREHRISPSVEHYACMVDLLGRSNHLDEAAKVIEDMQIQPGPRVWGSLLGSCRIHCNVVLGERASERLFELEPTNAGNYVLLADIYAKAKMRNEVERVKKLLDARGLKRIPGCSWIEIRKQMYSFVSVDEFNPPSEELHALLVELSREMEEAGFMPRTEVPLDLEIEENVQTVLSHSEKLAVAFGLINSNNKTIRITKNLRLCEDCHSFMKFVSKFAKRDILVRDVNRFHHFRDGICSCSNYW